MRHCILTLLSVLISFSIQSQEIKLEQLIGASYSSDLTVSDDRNSIAWVENKNGVRTIYTANIPKLEPVSIFTTNMDDGQVISNIKFDQSNEYLFFVHGSAPNKNGKAANPASFAIYPTRQLKRINLKTGDIKELGDYSSYFLLKDSGNLLLQKGNQLSELDVSTGSTKTLVKMRGNFNHVSLDVEGKRILFSSGRGDHGYIGMYTIGEDRIHWISPSVDSDIFPVWSPNEDKVAFIRMRGSTKGQLYNLTGGRSFSILIHDLNSEETNTIWESASDDGGFVHYYFNNPLNWSPSGHLWFYSEHEGFTNIYVMESTVKRMRSVIEGSYEVEQSSEHANGKAIVFSSNYNDVDRRDLFQYDFQTDKLTQLTSGENLETNPVILSDNSIVYREGLWDFPGKITRLVNGDIQPIFPVSHDNFPSKKHIRPEQVIFKTPDGYSIHGQLFAKDKDSQKPAIIFMHGGPIRQMLLGYHYSSYYANCYAMNQYLANQGYVVLSINFRSGIGYGRDFRRAENQGPRGASEYQDIVAGAKYLQALPYVDANKLGLYGGSYGGYLTAMGLARNSDIFKAGVDIHGVHDWSWRAQDFSPGGGWAIDESLMIQADSSSPISSLDNWKSPVLFIHGDDDRNVMFGQTVDLVQRLRDRNVELEFLVLPDEVHGFYRNDSWLRTFKATAKFFDKHLK